MAWEICGDRNREGGRVNAYILYEYLFFYFVWVEGGYGGFSETRAGLEDKCVAAKEDKKR